MTKYTIHTTTGPIKLMAATPADAIKTAEELMQSKVVRVEREGEWT